MTSDCSDDSSYEANDDSSDYMSDSLSLDLESEDGIINLKRTSDDPFLYKLWNQVGDEVESDVELNMDEGGDNVGLQVMQKGVEYPVHDPKVHWKLMKPNLVKGMRILLN